MVEAVVHGLQRTIIQGVDMAKKSKGREQIEQMIYRGHKRGVCDSDGNSIKSGGVPVARPRKIRGLRMRFAKGYKEIYQNGEWVRCES